jgi:hypothetical protein
MGVSFLLKLHQGAAVVKKFMKIFPVSGIGLIAAMILLGGCAPSVSVTQAGSSNQFEVSVRSSAFSTKTSEELTEDWHKKARETCDGGDYTIVSRDITTTDGAALEGIYISGVIECQ